MFFNYFTNEPKFQAILNEVKKLEERVNNFENIAKEQSKLFIQEDLRQVVADVVNTWSSTLAQKDIQLNIKKPARPIMAIANRRTLKVAILHVLKNAVESSPVGGEIKIEIADKDGNPTISISDKGSGIPQEIKTKLFEKTVTTKPKGAGMGLMLVKQILREHHGDIEIKSSDDNGTTVVMSFPVHFEEVGFSNNKPFAPHCTIS